MENNTNDLTSLIEENERLKDECNQLKKQLSSASLNSNLSMSGYYIQKYEKNYENVLSTRLSEIDLEIADYQKQIAAINNTLINIDELVEQNETYQNEIKILQERYDNNIKALKEKEEELLLAKEKLNNKQIILTNATIGYYNYIYKSLNPLEDVDQVNLNVEFVMTQLKEQLYDLVVDCGPINFKIMALEQEINSLKNEVKKDNDDIINEQVDMTLKVQSLTEEDLNQQKAALNEHINKCVQLKKELADTLELMKKKDEEIITDKVQYLTIQDLPKESIVSEVDQLIEKLTNQLMSTDTLKNLRIAKQLRLAELLEEKKAYNNLNGEYTLLKAMADEYYSAYLETSKSLDVLVDYLDSADLAINENDYYKRTIRDYKDLLEEKAQLEAQYQLAVSSYNEQLRVRQDKALYANSDSELKTLNHKINTLYAEKNRLQKCVKDLQNRVAEIETKRDNLTLLIVLKEKNNVEAKLPDIYEKLRELKIKVTNSKNNLTDLEAKIKRLDEINKEIEQLVYEINN